MAIELPPYSCIRCGYETKNKKDMRKHLYKRRSSCCSLKTDVVLTDEVKEIILNDRRYKIPEKIVEKKPEKISIKKTEEIVVNNYTHYIYLLQPKENASRNENVFKIGRTKTNGKDITRIGSYGKGSKLVSIKECINSDYCEKELLKIFNNTFEKYKFGNEYFIGNRFKMDTLICDFIRKERGE